jgi:hypothetical protein
LRRTRSGTSRPEINFYIFYSTTIDYGRASVQLAASTSYHQPSDSVVVAGTAYYNKAK